MTSTDTSGTHGTTGTPGTTGFKFYMDTSGLDSGQMADITLRLWESFSRSKILSDRAICRLHDGLLYFITVKNISDSDTLTAFDEVLLATTQRGMPMPSMEHVAEQSGSDDSDYDPTKDSDFGASSEEYESDTEDAEETSEEDEDDEMSDNELALLEELEELEDPEAPEELEYPGDPEDPAAPEGHDSDADSIDLGSQDTDNDDF